MSEMREDNARNPDQLRRMQELKRKKKCFFCDGNYEKVGGAPAIIYAVDWYARKNDYPYPGTKHHFVVAPHRHVRKLAELKPSEQLELFSIIEKLQKDHKMEGASVFIRDGDMAFTGATFDHLHVHLIQGSPKPANWESVENNNILVTLGYK